MPLKPAKAFCGNCRLSTSAATASRVQFDVRCGVNEGEVVIFDDSAVENLVEHTIDIAGHMQKQAMPGTLLVSKEVYEVLEDRAEFRPAGLEVDGYATYEWSPQAEPEKANG